MGHSDKTNQISAFTLFIENITNRNKRLSIPCIAHLISIGYEKNKEFLLHQF
jgi:hypothetical protein